MRRYNPSNIMNQQVSTAARESAQSASLTHGDRRQQAILRTLLYYDIFRFPLRLDELFRFSEFKWPDRKSLETHVRALANRELLTYDKPWIHLNNPTLVEERVAAEAKAARVLPRARRRSRLIRRFPFVRGVALSGTISKGVFTHGDDVDFFVITAPGRLWLCRVLLMGFKKLFLFNSRRTFCINYLVTEDHLEVPDRNLFTATEIAWLMPTINSDLFEKFEDANSWIVDFLPNWEAPTWTDAGPAQRHGLGRMIEWMFSGNRGDRLDDSCRSLVEKHNRRRYRSIDPTEFDLALRTAKNVSKHHPQSLQSRILEKFESRMQDFEAKHNVILIRK